MPYNVLGTNFLSSIFRIVFFHKNVADKEGVLALFAIAAAIRIKLRKKKRRWVVTLITMEPLF